jgi:hypothetical protein
MGESRDMLEAFFAKNQDTLPAFLDTLPARIGQFQGLDAELPRVGPAAAARIERRSAALQAELRTDALKAILGIDAGEDVSLEDLALRLGSLQQKTLPLLLGVIMGALSTPTEEGIPGIQLDLKEQVAGILGDALGAAVLTLTEPLKEKSPAANIIHTRIEALLKDEKKLAAFITALLNTFMPSA